MSQQGQFAFGGGAGERRPDPRERIGRKIEAMRKVLQLEQAKGHNDNAVFGGLDRFFERWVEDPDIQGALERARIVVPTYADLSAPERVSWVTDALQRLERAAPPADPIVAPSPPSAARLSSPPASSAQFPHPTKPPTSSQPLQQPSPSPVIDPEAEGPSPGQLRRTPSKGRGGRGQTSAPGRGSPALRQAQSERGKGGASRAPSPPSSLDDPLPLPPKTASAFKRLGIETYRQALWAFPRRYLQVVPVTHVLAGQQQAVAVTVLRATQRQFGKRRTLKATEALVGDDTGQLQAVWFGRTWIARTLKQGARFLLVGRLNEFRGLVRFNVESEEQLGPERRVRTGDLVPVYPLTEGVSQASMRRVIAPAAERALPLVKEYLPPDVRAASRLPGLQEAFRAIHGPADANEEQRARRRLAFDEMLLLQLGLLARRRTRQAELGAAIPADRPTLDRFLQRLPFRLTGDQRKALDELLGDMSRPAPMMRLLQGDVGSGKTVVAAAALVVAAAKGFQGALMAPTEVLAEQHFRTLTSLFSHSERASDDGGGPYRGFSGILESRPLRVALLTGSMSAGAKSQLHRLIADGGVDIAIGTHALIQEGVGFSNLGLAVVDEQHRFGVAQRAALRNKGFAPHLLVMTATPIPRTMALAVYGDLDVSTIREMPPGRVEVRTKALFPEERQRAYKFIREQAREGRQAFVICPLVEESEAVEAKAAVAEHERLSREVFPDLRLGLLHGRMRPAEKDEVMERFRRRDLDVLVSTAVVEVGIDIPNATVMMVEGAERFGLSQLHQYRGRVGRGRHASYCILVSDSDSPEARERLTLMETTRDGFVLAEADMQMRGPGEFFGTRQSGLPDLSVAALGDLSLVEEVRAVALALTQQDPELSQPEHRSLREEVKRFWARASEAPEGG
jgi:ATP-dependent DNA helicase RecG